MAGLNIGARAHSGRLQSRVLTKPVPTAVYGMNLALYVQSLRPFAHGVFKARAGAIGAYSIGMNNVQMGFS